MTSIGWAFGVPISWTFVLVSHQVRSLWPPKLDSMGRARIGTYALGRAASVLCICRADERVGETRGGAPATSGAPGEKRDSQGVRRPSGRAAGHPTRNEKRGLAIKASDPPRAGVIFTSLPNEFSSAPVPPFVRIRRFFTCLILID